MFRFVYMSLFCPMKIKYNKKRKDIGHTVSIVELPRELLIYSPVISLLSVMLIYLYMVYPFKTKLISIVKIA